MKIENVELVSIRGVILLLNFTINIYLAHKILFDLGQEFFSYYAVLIALPALIPFADLGLGASVFNLYVDHSSVENLKRHLSKIFYISILGSFIQILVFTILILRFFDSIVPEYGSHQKTNVMAILILIITYFAVPLSLASKKLQADNRIETVLRIQGMIPLLNLSGYILVRNIFPSNPTLVVLIPSISYFLTNLIIFWRSQIIKNLNIHFLYSSVKEVKQELNLGFWVVVMSGLTAISWQFPKYFFSFQGDTLSVTRYTIFLMIGMAAFSIIQLPAVKISPKVRLNPKSSLKLLRSELKDSFTISMLLSISLLFIFEISAIRNMLAINNDYRILLATIILIAPLWILPSNTFSFTLQYKHAAISMLCLLIVCIFFLYTFRLSEFRALVIYLLLQIITFSMIFWAIHFKEGCFLSNNPPFKNYETRKKWKN